MKKLYTLLLMTGSMLMATIGYTQQVGINHDGSLPNPNAILDVKALDKGVLFPRMSTGDRLGIPNTKGLLVYDTTTHSFWYNTGTAWQNMASGTSMSNGWLLTGNSGTGAPHFLGTTDLAPFRIKINGQPSGLLHVNGNTFWGYNSGAFSDPDSSFNNTATGKHSLYRNVKGFDNTATGTFSMYSNTSGFQNTAYGWEALLANTIGNQNVAVGAGALRSNVKGEYNTATGAFAMELGDIAKLNTAVGAFALRKTTSSRGTAVGFEALSNATSGSGNTAVGTEALNQLTTGYLNTAIGQSAAAYVEHVYNSTAIGAYSVVNAHDKIRLGDVFITRIEGQVPFTTPSDGRFKVNVSEDVSGLDFILKLRPVTYLFDLHRFDDHLHKNVPDSARRREFDGVDYEAAASVRRSGFIAQEVEAAAKAAGYNFSGVLKPQTEQDYYGISYETFIPSVVKALQELNDKIDRLEKENALLKSELKRTKPTSKPGLTNR